jgi:peptide/nickel transport system ATP-binding protein
MDGATMPESAEAGRPPVVSVEGLYVRFTTPRATVHAVNDISFDLEPGRVLGILGESGSGKSVTLRALIGLLPPRRTRIEGCIKVAGHDITRMDERALREVRGTKIAMIFQEPMTALDPVFTIGEQIAETIVRHEALSYETAYRRALDLLDMVQIPSAARRLKAYPHEISGGMRQRAMIALALSCRPSVLLADEPTTALDVTVQIQIILLLRQLQQKMGMAVIFVTHDVGVAAEVSDRLAVMYAGRFVETGPTETVIETPAHPYTAGLLASTVLGSARGQPLEAIPGMPPDLGALPPGCSFAPRCRFAEARCCEAPTSEFALSARHTVRCRRVAAGEIEVAKPSLSDRAIMGGTRHWTKQEAANC